MTNSNSAEIYDRGYRVYDGPRTGMSTAMKSVFSASVQRALGLRRKFRFKVVPILTILIAFVPALIFVGVAIVLPADLGEELVDYSGYFGLTGIAVMLFTAFVTPELLITDRRTGMFGLYLSSPLGKLHYLTAKLRALVTVVSMVTLLPALFLMIGYILVGSGPEGFVDTIKLAGQIFLSGLIVALFYSLFGMAVSTISNRQGVASAVIIMFFLASAFLANTLVDEADAPDWMLALSFIELPVDVAARIFDEPFNQLDGLSTATSAVVLVGVMVLSAAVTWFGYQRIEVTK